MIKDLQLAEAATRSEAPTRARYGVLAFLCTLALLLYLDRVCIGKAAPSIRRDLGLSETQMAWVFNAFTLAYCLFEVPTGNWGDRHGGRGVIARIVVWWSVFTALTGAAGGLWSLLAVRFLFGAGEAGAFPNASRVVTRWFPPDDAARPRAITTAPWWAAPLPPFWRRCDRAVGWRPCSPLSGGRVVWAAIFYYWFRDDPAEHPAVNAAERRGLRVGAPRSEPTRQFATRMPTQSPRAHRIPWRTVLSSPNVWLLGAIMTVSAILSYVQFSGTDLLEGPRAEPGASGWLRAGSWPAAQPVRGGRPAADAVMRRTRERKWSRRWCAPGAAAGGTVVRRAAVRLGPRRDGLQRRRLSSCRRPSQPGGPSSRKPRRHGAAMWGLMKSMAGLGLMAAPSPSARSSSGGSTPATPRWILDRLRRRGRPGRGPRAG